MEEYLIITKEGTGEIVEKKSRFIAHVFPIKDKEEALNIIEETKKKYWDARHNCFAFVLGENYELQRFSDDGEPQGTAGKPILDVLLNNNIHNSLIIVTRYFGGTLLGTGGLVRAYSQSSKEGLKNSEIKQVSMGVGAQIITDYNSLGKIKYILANNDIAPLKEEYTENITINIEVSNDLYGSIKKQIIDVTAGKAEFKNETKKTIIGKQVKI